MNPCSYNTLTTTKNSQYNNLAHFAVKWRLFLTVSNIIKKKQKDIIENGMHEACNFL